RQRVTQSRSSWARPQRSHRVVSHSVPPASSSPAAAWISPPHRQGSGYSSGHSGHAASPTMWSASSPMAKSLGRLVPGASPADQPRDLSVGEYFARLAAEDERRYAAPPVGGHGDQIAPLRPGGIEDRLIGMILGDVHRLTGDTHHVRF